MKNRIKPLFLILCCASFIMLSNNANAQRMKNRPLKQRVVKHHIAKRKINMAQAHQVMKKTNWKTH